MTAPDRASVPVADANAAVLHALENVPGHVPDWDGRSTIRLATGEAHLSAEDAALALPGLAEARDLLARPHPECAACEDRRIARCDSHAAEFERAVALTGLLARLGGDPW